MTDTKFKKILDRDNWRCQYPGCWARAIRLSYRIPPNKEGRAWVQEEMHAQFYEILNRKSVDTIINHDFNIVSVCGKIDHGLHFAVDGEPQKTLEKIYRDLYSEVKK